MSKSKTIPTKYLPDGEAILRAAVASIPQYGGALDHLLFDKVDKIRIENIQKSIAALSERLENIEISLIDAGWFKSKKALAIFRLLAERVSFEPDEEKVSDLGHIVAICGLKSHSNDSRQLSIVEHLSRLSPVQIRILKVLSHIQPKSKDVPSGDLQYTITGIWLEDIEHELGASPPFWEGILNYTIEIEILESLNTVRKVSSAANAYDLTALGKYASTYVNDATV